MDKLVVICSWCRKTIRTGGKATPSGVSHGICRECAEAVRYEMHVHFKR